MAYIQDKFQSRGLSLNTCTTPSSIHFPLYGNEAVYGMRPLTAGSATLGSWTKPELAEVFVHTSVHIPP